LVAALIEQEARVSSTKDKGRPGSSRHFGQSEEKSGEKGLDRIWGGLKKRRDSGKKGLDFKRGMSYYILTSRKEGETNMWKLKLVLARWLLGCSSSELALLLVQNNWPE